jgi:serine/threonine protein kinase/tetratricopeptide (TPR) repeat protein
MTLEDIVTPQRPTLDDVDFRMTKAKVRQALLQRGSAATKVGRFEIVGRAGAGAMGRVLIGRDADLGRELAIKLIAVHASEPAAIERLRARLLREARALASLSHPNVVTAYEVGVSDGDVYIAMEYVRGQTLRKWSATPRSWREIVAVLVQAGQGLAAAHSAGFVHRDFKPDNVLVGDDGRVRVADFGLARGPRDRPEDEDEASQDASSKDEEGAHEADHLTRTGARVGTPAYQAPEVADGESATAASDQYAFCVVLHEALHGVRPGRGPAPVARPLPRWLSRAIERGLSPDPRRRYPNMRSLVDELRRPRVMGRTVAALAGLLGLGAMIAAGSLSWLQPAPCEGLAHGLDGVWDPGARAQLQVRFAAEPRAYARDLGTRFVPALDAYAQRWVAQRIEACEATGVRGEAAAPVLARRVACLEERRAELSDTVVALAQPTALRFGPTLVAELTAPEECGAALGETRPQDPPPSLRDAVSAVRRGLARVRVQERTGDLRTAATRAQALRLRAEAIGFAPLVTEVASRLGRIEGRLDDPRAERTLRDAIWQAEAGRLDQLAADTWLHLVAWSTEQESEPARTAPMLERASAAVQRLGDPPALRMRLHVLSGRLATAAARYDDALTELHEAAALFRERDPEGAGYADVLDALAAVHFHRGEYDTATTLYEESVALSERVFGPVHPRVADRLQNLATVLVAHSDPASAIPKFERARQILLDAYGADHSKLSAVENGLGAALEGVARLPEAAAHYARALEIAQGQRGPEHPTLISPLTNLGRVLPRLQRAAEGEANLARALAIAEASYGAEHPRVADPLTSLGQLRISRGDAQGAVEVHARALAIRRAAAGDDALATAIAAHNLGDALTAAGRGDEALPHLHAAARVFDAELPPDHAYRVANAAVRARAEADDTQTLRNSPTEERP